MIFWLILIIVVTLVVYLLMRNTVRNVDTVERTVDQVFTTILQENRLIPFSVEGVENVKTANGKFRYQQYYVEGIGNLGILSNDGFLRQRLIVFLLTKDKDLPSFRGDIQYFWGKRTINFEVFDDVIDQGSSYQKIQDILKATLEPYEQMKDDPDSNSKRKDNGISLSKTGSSKEDIYFIKMIVDTLDVMVKQAKLMPELTSSQKQSKKEKLETLLKEDDALLIHYQPKDGNKQVELLKEKALSDR